MGVFLDRELDVSGLLYLNLSKPGMRCLDDEDPDGTALRTVEEGAALDEAGRDALAFWRPLVKLLPKEEVLPMARPRREPELELDDELRRLIALVVLMGLESGAYIFPDGLELCELIVP